MLIPIGPSIGILYATTVISNNDGCRPNNFVILDWDLRVLDARVDEWVPLIPARLEELHATVSKTYPYNMYQYCDSFEEGYAEYFRQRGLAIAPLREDLPPLKERANRAQPYIQCGLVTIARPAWTKEVAFRGVKRNFLREILAHTEPPESPLMLALATAVLTKYHDEPALPPPSPPKSEAFPLPPAPPPAPLPSGVWLKPGPHTIDGRVVEVPRAGDADQVFHELPPGRYIIDSKIAIVHSPGAGGLRLW